MMRRIVLPRQTFEVVVREMLLVGVAMIAASCMVLAVELRDRGSDWAVVAFFAQAGWFVLAGYLGYSVDRRGPLPREIDFQRLREGLDANRVRLVDDGTGYNPLADEPMPTAKRGGIRWGELAAEPPSASLTPPCDCGGHPDD